MKRALRATRSLIAPLVLLAACGGTETPAPRYRSDGRALRDRQGRALLLRGINIPNDYDQRGPGTLPTAPTETFHHIATSGFNAVRLVIEWARIEPEPARYDTAYLDLFEQHARLAAAAGLFVLVDMHQDFFGRGFGGDGAPTWACDQSLYDSYMPASPAYLDYFTVEVRTCFDRFWRTRSLRQHQEDAARAAAERVADLDLVIGFEPMNEPFAGLTDFAAFERDFLMPFHTEFAAAVGEVLPERAFFVEPMLTFGAIGTTALPGPIAAFTGYFAPHYYNRSIEGASRWDGEGRDVRAVVQGASSAAADLGVPWGFGEVGGAKETPNLAEYLFFLYDLLDAEQAGAFLWLYQMGDAGFGLIDAATDDWTPHARAFLRPAPSKIAGTVVSFRWDYAGRLFRLDWQADRDAGESEIILPAWVSEVGYSLVLDGEPVSPALDASGSRILVPGGASGPRWLELRVNGPYPR